MNLHSSWSKSPKRRWLLRGSVGGNAEPDQSRLLSGFWLADCQQVSDTVALATLIYKELICVPYLAKFVVFAKPIDVAEAQLRCFCMTDDKVDKTLEQQEDFEEVARSKDTEISEGKPIYVHCYGNLSPASKISQQLFFTFDAFKENRLPFIVKVWDIGQEPCGRLAFLKELKTTKGLAQSTICNLNFTLPAQKKVHRAHVREQTFAWPLWLIIWDLAGLSWHGK